MFRITRHGFLEIEMQYALRWEGMMCNGGTRLSSAEMKLNHEIL